MTKHNFARSLAAGQAGEKLLLSLWPQLTPTDGRRGDFLLPSGEKMEVKSDSYDHNKTSNLFVERWSDFDAKKPGGAHQAQEHGAAYFFYWFPLNRIGYMFSVQDLVDFMDNFEFKYSPVLIENRSWTTVGYKVPREDLKAIYTKKEFKI